MEMTNLQQSQKKAESIASESETGSRKTTGNTKHIIIAITLCWSLFQLWYASPLPFLFKFAIFNNTEARAIHLSFAVFLAFLLFPFNKNTQNLSIPLIDWGLALLASFSAFYLYLFSEQLALRPGLPTNIDIAISITGLILLIEAARRTLGPPLMIVALVFITYAFAGPYMPDIIAHRGSSINQAMSHYWLSTEGVFGIAIGVSTNFVFAFVLFGALLEKAGAGQYFIQVAFSFLGHLKGGPAKAAVVSSGLSGVVSGSSIANVVTTGTFTIPLMKRVGFPAHKAGAIEVAASTNGQLTPPVMGAAAFLMVDYVGISYIEVIKAALLPALISYIALFYMVHLEACKANMKGIPKKHQRTKLQALTSFVGMFTGLCALGALVYYGIGWTRQLMGDYASIIISLVLIAGYLGLVKLAAKQPEIQKHQNNLEDLPHSSIVLKSGLYFLLPIVVLLWCLTVERFSPGLSAFWSTLIMIFISITHKPLLNYFKQKSTPFTPFKDLKEGYNDLIQGLIGGAHNMITIGVATATAGLVVGSVTLTGIGLVMTEFVEWISNGNLILILTFTAVISLILGMGLPTTANYIVVSTLMAPVIVTLGAQNGLIVPLIAVHLFVFYFGILADDTPPVGLAAFAAAALAQADPIKTGIQGFIYDIRTAILPFMFIFNTKLLLIGITGWFDLSLVVASAIIAMLIFAAATQGFWITKNKWYETIGLLLITFVLFRPGFIWDKLYSPYQEYIGSEQIMQGLNNAPINSKIRVWVSGENYSGQTIKKLTLLPTGPNQSSQEKLKFIGIETYNDNGLIKVNSIAFQSPAEKAGIDFDWILQKIELSSPRPSKKLIWIPALLLLCYIYFNQKKRKDKIII